MERKAAKFISMYARVSSTKQAKDMTISSQIQALLDNAKKDGFTIDKNYMFIDEGHSGSTLLRPALERLRDAVANGLIEKLYVLSPDRLARKYAYQYLLIEEFRKHGLEISFLNNSHQDDPESNLLLQVQGMISEYERAKILERNRRGKIFAAKQGKVSVLSCAPYGYKYINRHINGKGGYIINAPEAKIIRQVFEWVGIDGLSLNASTTRLTESGVPTPTGINANWNRASLLRMLKNPAYMGRAAFGKLKSVPKKTRVHLIRGDNVPGKSTSSSLIQSEENWIYIPVEPIIDCELFNLVQEKLKENKKRKRERKSGFFFLLRGLVVCGKCKYSYTGSSNGQQHFYYVCTGTRNYSNRKAFCNNKSINAREIEDIVWEEVKRLLENPKRIKKEFQKRLDEIREEKRSDGDQYRLKAQMKKLEKSTSRLIDCYTDGLIDKNEFEPRIKHLKEEMHIIKEEEEKFRILDDQKKHLSLVIGRLEEFSRRVQARLQDSTEEEKREVALAIIKRIEIGENDVSITFRVDQLRETDQSDFVEHCCRGVKSRSKERS